MRHLLAKGNPRGQIPADSIPPGTPGFPVAPLTVDNRRHDGLVWKKPEEVNSVGDDETVCAIRRLDHGGNVSFFTWKLSGIGLS